MSCVRASSCSWDSHQRFYDGAAALAITTDGRLLPHHLPIVHGELGALTDPDGLAVDAVKRLAASAPPLLSTSVSSSAPAAPELKSQSRVRGCEASGRATIRTVSAAPPAAGGEKWERGEMTHERPGPASGKSPVEIAQKRQSPTTQCC